MAAELPRAEPPISAITNMYTAERYGRKASTPAEAETQADIVDEAWIDTRGNILRRFLQRFLPGRKNRGK